MTLGELIHGLMNSQEASQYNHGSIYNAELVMSDGSFITTAKITQEHPREEGELYIVLGDAEHRWEKSK